MITKFRPRTMHTTPFNNLVSDLMGRDIGQFLGHDDMSTNRPKVNITETPDKFIISMLVPGFSKTDLKISNEKETLTIKGERGEATMNENERYTRREFQFGAFERSFTLPVSVEMDSISAEYMDGVLNVTVPRKAPAKPTVRSISIN